MPIKLLFFTLCAANGYVIFLILNTNLHIAVYFRRSKCIGFNIKLLSIIKFKYLKIVLKYFIHIFFLHKLTNANYLKTQLQ